MLKSSSPIDRFVCLPFFCEWHGFFIFIDNLCKPTIPLSYDRPADTHNNTCKMMKVFRQISIRLIKIDLELLLKNTLMNVFRQVSTRFNQHVSLLQQYYFSDFLTSCTIDNLDFRTLTLFFLLPYILIIPCY